LDDVLVARGELQELAHRAQPGRLVPRKGDRADRLYNDAIVPAALLEITDDLLCSPRIQRASLHHALVEPRDHEVDQDADRFADQPLLDILGKSLKVLQGKRLGRKAERADRLLVAVDVGAHAGGARGAIDRRRARSRRQNRGDRDTRDHCNAFARHASTLAGWTVVCDEERGLCSKAIAWNSAAISASSRNL